MNLIVGCPISNGEEVLVQMSMSDVLISANIAYLICLTIVFHLIAFLGLRFMRPRIA